MRKIFFFSFFMVTLVLYFSSSAIAADDGLVAWWKFDKPKDKVATDSISQIDDEIGGNFKYTEGVSGKAIRFDGYTVCLTRRAAGAPSLRDAFTVEAWIAPQVYPWNWTAIVDREKEHKAGYFFGVDAEGYVGLQLAIDGRWQQCRSNIRLPLLKWSHIAGTFDKDRGINIYINGKSVGSLLVKGPLTVAEDVDLFIGRSHRKMSPQNTERTPSRKLLSNMIFDGLIDEVKIYNYALSAEQIGQSYAAVRPKQQRPLTWRVMPSGPKDLPKRFTAYYTRLRYADEWENLWRVGPYPDILITFDKSPVRVVFWRGTNYGASWVTENGIWMGDQSLEDGGTGWGCCEHMSDKQCRYSYVRLIENSDARIVVHWRYAVADIRYTINHTDPVTGWGDWVDEYYYIYPDVVATRKQVLWTSRPGGFQWQETIFFSQPGTCPEDNVEIGALTLANMEGQTHTYSWANGAPESYPIPGGANIQMTNLKARNRPFIIFEPGRRITAFGGGNKLSHFPWWNHWPVAQLPNDGRVVTAPDRPSSSSLSNRKPIPVHREGDSYIAVSLCGMTEKSALELVPLAKSWNHPPELEIMGAGFSSDGYNRGQRAYILRRTVKYARLLKFTLKASADAPIMNPCFVIKNWVGTTAARLEINDVEQKQGPDFRQGIVRDTDGKEMIVIWLRLESTKPMTIFIRPASH